MWFRYLTHNHSPAKKWDNQIVDLMILLFSLSSWNIHQQPRKTLDCWGNITSTNLDIFMLLSSFYILLYYIANSGTTKPHKSPHPDCPLKRGPSTVPVRSQPQTFPRGSAGWGRYLPGYSALPGEKHTSREVPKHGSDFIIIYKWYVNVVNFHESWDWKWSFNTP